MSNEEFEAELPLLSTEDDASSFKRQKRRICIRKRHVTCKRCTIITGIVGGLLILIVFIFMRPIANASMKQSEIVLLKMSLSNPLNETVIIDTNLLIHSKSSFKATIRSFPATLEYQNEPFAVFHAPEMILTHHKTLVNITNTTLSITNQSIWTQFSKNMIRKEQLTWRLSGTVDVSIYLLGFIPLTISQVMLSKSMNIKGMNGLSNVTIHDFNLPQDSKKGEVLITDTSIYNPSCFSMRLKGVVLELYLPKHHDQLGYVVAHDLLLQPGENRMQLKGELKPVLIGKHKLVSNETNAFFSNFLRNEKTTVTVEITKIQSNCTWLRQAIEGLCLSTELKGVGDAFQLMSDLKMLEMDVRIQKNSQMFVRSSIQSHVALPHAFQIPLSISHLSSLVFTINTNRNESIGKLATGPQNCTYNPSNGLFLLNMTKFYALQPNSAVVAEFIQQLVLGANDLNLRIDTTQNQGVSPLIQTNMGTLALQHIPTHSSFSIHAMDSFKAIPLQIISMDISQGSREGLELQLMIHLFNPSAVATAMGSLVLYVEYEKETLAVANLNQFSVKCCNQTTELISTVVFRPSETQKSLAARFLSDFVSQYYSQDQPQRVRMYGRKSSSKFEILKPTLEKISILTVIPPLKELYKETPTLVLSARMYRPSILHLTQIYTTLALANPFSVGFRVLAANFTMLPCKKANGSNCIEYYSQPLAQFNPSPFHTISVPAHTKVCYSCCQGKDCDTLPMCPDALSCMAATVLNIWSAEAIAAMFSTASKTGLLITINGTLTIDIDGYQSLLHYQQTDLRVLMAT